MTDTQTPAQTALTCLGDAPALVALDAVLAEALQPVARTGTLAEALAQTGVGTAVVVPVPDPAADLARAVAAGASAADALADWAARTETLIAANARDRARCVLVDADALIAGDAAVWQALDARLGGALGPAPRPVAQDTAPVAALDRVMAHLRIMADPAAATLAGTLEALSIRAPGQAAALVADAEAALTGHIENAETRIASLETEAEALRAHIALTVQAADAESRKIADLRGSLAAVPRLEAEADALRGRARLAEANAEARAAVLGAALMARAPDPEAAAAAQAEADALRAQIATLEAELSEVYGSTSWRVTGGLRSVGRRLK